MDSDPPPGSPIDEWLQKYLPSVEAFMRLRAGALVRAKESCADLAQSVCREILENRDRLQYDGEVGFRRWLFTTARRKIADRVDYYKALKRDVGREIAASPTVESDMAPGAAVLDQYGTLYTPSREMAAKEELQRVEAAFDRLPEDHQEVILMARILRMSRREIGEQTGRSEQAVRSLLYRALAGLAEEIARSEKQD